MNKVLKKVLISSSVAASILFVGCASTSGAPDMKSEIQSEAMAENQESVEKKDFVVQDEDKSKTEENSSVDEKSENNVETKGDEKQTETLSKENPVEEIDDETKTTDVESEKEDEGEEPSSENLTDENREETTDEENLDDSGYVSASSLDGACKIAKFKMESPKTFAVFKADSFKAVPENKIDVTYINTKKDGEEFVVRKGVGNLDVSVDRKKYQFESFVTNGGVRAMVLGDEYDLFNVATWTSGEYSYSFESNVGFPKDVIFALIQEIN